ncbi:hypothetical protein H4218_002185 [Coemansia sp. IMI 209128]|nr:hypothetical protein H4218_002185 [Coemansia sp. IMI 209128]
MCACSVFQLLPEHIVKLIVDHVACHGRMRFDGLYLASDESKALQMPLLWVCRNFRDFVYQRFCREYALNLLSDPTDNYIRHPSWPYWLLDFDHYLTNRLTKELLIITDIRDVCSGKSLRHLSSAPYDGCAFPLVHTLSLYTFVGKESYEEGCPPDSEANIMAFVQRVKEVVPAVRVVNQDVGCSDAMPFEEYGSYAKFLISKLYQIVGVAEISSRNRLPGITLELEPIGRLTSVDWDFDGSDSRILALARQSSQSLQSLRLISAFEKDIGELFWDLDNHSYVSYPCLHSLTLKFANVSPVSQKSTFDGAIPFPRLSHLYILSQYPFGDDVVFRGNEATLECLNLPLFSEVVALLRRHRVFMRNSHPKLRDVNIGSYLGDKPNSFDSASDFMKFIVSG